MQFLWVLLFDLHHSLVWCFSGALFDKTQNYDVPFYTAFVVGIFASVGHFMLVCLEKWRHRKQEDHPETEFSKETKCKQCSADKQPTTSGVNGHDVQKRNGLRTISVWREIKILYSRRHGFVVGSRDQIIKWKIKNPVTAPHVHIISLYGYTWRRSILHM